MSLTLKITSLFNPHGCEAHWCLSPCTPYVTLADTSAELHQTPSSRTCSLRAYCVTFAQNLHKIDMRLRLGLLQDPVAIDRAIAREEAEAEPSGGKRSRSCRCRPCLTRRRPRRRRRSARLCTLRRRNGSRTKQKGRRSEDTTLDGDKGD
ncbi:hypothetical protein MRB53_036897 [Persea americana]|nr:hypothetical protein MRB53_036897 [Persea americana]